ncbi:MAG TPA: hypothetical protein VGJ54_02395, partial [Streptosporangiaceae bacterium]
MLVVWAIRLWSKSADRVRHDALTNVGATIQAELARRAVDDQAEAILRAVIEIYAAGDETVRAAIRKLFDRHKSFRWAAHLPRDWDGSGGRLAGTVGQRTASRKPRS